MAFISHDAAEVRGWTGVSQSVRETDTMRSRYDLLSGCVVRQRGVFARDSEPSEVDEHREDPPSGTVGSTTLQQTSKHLVSTEHLLLLVYAPYFVSYSGCYGVA